MVPYHKGLRSKTYLFFHSVAILVNKCIKYLFNLYIYKKLNKKLTEIIANKFRQKIGLVADLLQSQHCTAHIISTRRTDGRCELFVVNIEYIVNSE